MLSKSSPPIILLLNFFMRTRHVYFLFTIILLITKFLDNIICYQVDNIIGGEDFDNIFCYQLITLSTRPESINKIA
ncbi:hypothetical protein BpHYR1_010436 [Brachionus plicatilis]|uniref:Uncharacterized protein n=1 Tax=Brachionus plicatilis TaxID=10195 RepID=A0A3M7QVM9_BRAPC|nr:hypothetical protein BpHYR1_010436 [Brachionus plicatilis]